MASAGVTRHGGGAPVRRFPREFAQALRELGLAGAASR